MGRTSRQDTGRTGKEGYGQDGQEWLMGRTDVLSTGWTTKAGCQFIRVESRAGRLDDEWLSTV